MTSINSSLSKNPLLNFSSLLLVGLSLSIGWGIRGNFGHESGAWLPGALSAMAICLLSGREDWWRRACYCGLFGALGYGFGGSISYMVPMSYASSGHFQSMWFGYLGVFLIGGLWAGLGGAGIALPLSIDRGRLTSLFPPLIFVLVAIYLGKWLQPILAQWLQPALGQDLVATTIKPMFRHENPLYWLDSDWFEASMAIVGVCAYDLIDRRAARIHWLVVWSLLGALAGFLIHTLLAQTGLTEQMFALLVVPQGDAAAIDPKTQMAFDPTLFIANWPIFLLDHTRWIGGGLGLLIGLGFYFFKHGQWRNDAGLFLSMALGWWIAFLLMPVLLTIPFQHYGGFRLTPPRGDNWAGMIGVFCGMLWYTWKHDLVAVSLAGSLNFILGGIAFPTAHLLRNMAKLPGNSDFPLPDEVIQSWRHYQSANWHSVLEQSQGFALGLITTLTMAVLWRRLPVQSDQPAVRRWTDLFAIAWLVFGLTWVNAFKNVLEWTHGGVKLVPELMAAPLISSIKLSAAVWFGMAWWTIAAVFVGLMIVHLRRGLAIVPSSWVGRGQIVYLLVLWIMVVTNLQRAMASNFHESRLITEWVIIINAALATALIVAQPRDKVQVDKQASGDLKSTTIRTFCYGFLIGPALMIGYAFISFHVFESATIKQTNIRWGDSADWRIRPLLKHQPHR